MTRVLIVEDEAAIAELIALNLRYAGYEVALVADAPEADRAVERVRPDLAILDWMLHGHSGLALAQRWRDDPRTCDLPIIMVTARAHEADRIAGLEAGADDYITKPFSMNELLARVRTVLRRRAPQVEESAAEVAGLRLDPATRRVTASGEPLQLGPTEFRLLHFLMKNPERVHTRRQLMNHVWGHQARIEERTVDVHVKRLRAALMPAKYGAIIETVRGAGYRMASSFPVVGAGASQDRPEPPPAE